MQPDILASFVQPKFCQFVQSWTIDSLHHLQLARDLHELPFVHSLGLVAAIPIQGQLKDMPVLGIMCRRCAVSSHCIQLWPAMWVWLKINREGSLKLLSVLCRIIVAGRHMR